jgi:hypothetical protein
VEKPVRGLFSGPRPAPPALPLDRESAARDGERPEDGPAGGLFAPVELFLDRGVLVRELVGIDVRENVLELFERIGAELEAVTLDFLRAAAGDDRRFGARRLLGDFGRDRRGAEAAEARL